MDFLANENFPLLSVRLIRNAGHNVTSVLEETSGAKDIDVLKRAHREKLIVLTFDRDYGELVYRHKVFTAGGIVYFRFDPHTPEEPAEILLAIFEEGKVVLLGRFTIIERGRIRQRPMLS